MTELTCGSTSGCTRPRPSRFDLLVGVVALVAALLPVLLAGRSEMLAMPPPWLLVGACVVGAALLVERRRHLWPVWGATTVVGLVVVGAGAGPTSAYLPAVVALFAVSVRVTTARAVLAGLVSAFAPVVLILCVGGNGAFDALAFRMSPWSAIAVLSGIVVRSQRAVVAAAHERARLAEATREEEAERRVTEERFRIARELHDVLGHHVSVINVQAGVAGYLVRTDPDSAALAMAHVREASQTVLREVSDILGLLRRDDEGVDTAPVPTLAEVDALVERARRAGVQVVWQSRGEPHELAPSVDLTAYRVLQEALTNAARHGTGSVRVQLAYGEGALTLEVVNDRADRASSASGAQHGLIGMRERVTAVGGTLAAGPGEDGAWVVAARLPAGAGPVREVAAR